ncbi:MAG: PRC-barrel domain-containing protein [Planctomycetales bacterium]|nr:PRC-barrel domain-containing protein [Planctomycetales bacterium]
MLIRILKSSGAASTVASLAASIALAQTTQTIDDRPVSPVQPPATQSAIDYSAETSQRHEARKAVTTADYSSHAKSVRASELIGMDIVNAEGKELGEVSDLVLGGENGKIRYAAVSYGGFLGMGDKLFAVPWESFQCQRNGGEMQLVLNVSEERLKKAEGFDQSQWPDFADENFTRRIDKHYGVDSHHRDLNERDARGLNDDHSSHRRGTNTTSDGHINQ